MLRYLGYSLFCSAVKRAKLLHARSFQEGSLNGKRVGKLWRSAPPHVRHKFRQLARVARPYIGETAGSAHYLRLNAQRRVLLSRTTFNLVMKWVYATKSLRSALSATELTLLAASTTKQLTPAHVARVKEGTRTQRKAKNSSGSLLLKKAGSVDPKGLFACCITTPEIAQYAAPFQAFLVFKELRLPKRSRQTIEHYAELWDEPSFQPYKTAFADLAKFERYCALTVLAYPALHLQFCDPRRRHHLGRILVAGFLTGDKAAFGKRLPDEVVENMRSKVGLREGDNAATAACSAATLVKTIKSYIRSAARGRRVALRARTKSIKGVVVPPSTYTVGETKPSQDLLGYILQARSSLPNGGIDMTSYQWAVLASNSLRSQANREALLSAYDEFKDAQATQRTLSLLERLDEPGES